VIGRFLQAVPAEQIIGEGAHVAGDMTHLADLAIGNELCRFGDERLVVPTVRNEDFTLFLGRQLHHRTRISGTGRHRLVDEDMAPCLQRGARVLEMHGVR
jgi:hypothetical protein